MILKRVQKGDVIKAIYESSNILASKYDKTSKDLTVTFKRGDQYTYKGVSESDYFRFETADSQGRVLNKTIKEYAFEKLDAIDPKKILAEIDKIKDAEILEFEQGVVKFMAGVVDGFNNNGELNQKDLDFLCQMNTKLSELKGVTEEVDG